MYAVTFLCPELCKIHSELINLSLTLTKLKKIGSASLNKQEVHLVEANRLFQIASYSSAKTLSKSKLEQGHWQFMQAKPKTAQSITFASEQRSSSANNISRTASWQHFWSWKCIMYLSSFLLPWIWLQLFALMQTTAYDYVPPSHCWLLVTI